MNSRQFSGSRRIGESSLLDRRNMLGISLNVAAYGGSPSLFSVQPVQMPFVAKGDGVEDTSNYPTVRRHIISDREREDFSNLNKGPKWEAVKKWAVDPGRYEGEKRYAREQAEQRYEQEGLDAEREFALHDDPSFETPVQEISPESVAATEVGKTTIAPGAAGISGKLSGGGGRRSLKDTPAAKVARARAAGSRLGQALIGQSGGELLDVGGQIGGGALTKVAQRKTRKEADKLAAAEEAARAAAGQAKADEKSAAKEGEEDKEAKKIGEELGEEQKWETRMTPEGESVFVPSFGDTGKKQKVVSPASGGSIFTSGQEPATAKKQRSGEKVKTVTGKPLSAEEITPTRYRFDDDDPPVVQEVPRDPTTGKMLPIPERPKTGKEAKEADKKKREQEEFKEQAKAREEELKRSPIVAGITEEIDPKTGKRISKPTMAEKKEEEKKVQDIEEAKTVIGGKPTEQKKIDPTWLDARYDIPEKGLETPEDVQKWKQTRKQYKPGEKEAEIKADIQQQKEQEQKERGVEGRAKPADVLAEEQEQAKKQEGKKGKRGKESVPEAPISPDTLEAKRKEFEEQFKISEVSPAVLARTYGDKWKMMSEEDKKNAIDKQKEKVASGEIKEEPSLSPKVAEKRVAEEAKTKQQIESEKLAGQKALEVALQEKKKKTEKEGGYREVLRPKILSSAEEILGREPVGIGQREKVETIPAPAKDLSSVQFPKPVSKVEAELQRTNLRSRGEAPEVKQPDVPLKAGVEGKVEEAKKKDVVPSVSPEAMKHKEAFERAESLKAKVPVPEKLGSTLSGSKLAAKLTGTAGTKPTTGPKPGEMITGAPKAGQQSPGQTAATQPAKPPEQKVATVQGSTPPATASTPTATATAPKSSTGTTPKPQTGSVPKPAGGASGKIQLKSLRFANKYGIIKPGLSKGVAIKPGFYAFLQ